MLLVPLIQRAIRRITVGAVTARTGQKSTVSSKYLRASMPATNIPVIVVNGAKPGPKLALWLPDRHGTEYASIVALEKLAQAADPANLSGALIIVPLVNVASFAQKVPHLNPVDGQEHEPFLSPASPMELRPERASWAITQQVIEKCDYLIDLHGGDLDENLYRYSYWANTANPTLDATTRAMVLAFGLDHIILQDYRKSPGVGRSQVDQPVRTRKKEARRCRGSRPCRHHEYRRRGFIGPRLPERDCAISKCWPARRPWSSIPLWDLAHYSSDQRSRMVAF